MSDVLIFFAGMIVGFLWLVAGAWLLKILDPCEAPTDKENG